MSSFMCDAIGNVFQIGWRRDAKIGIGGCLGSFAMSQHALRFRTWFLCCVRTCLAPSNTHGLLTSSQVIVLRSHHHLGSIDARHTNEPHCRIVALGLVSLFLAVPFTAPSTRGATYASSGRRFHSRRRSACVQNAKSFLCWNCE